MASDQTVTSVNFGSCVIRICRVNPALVVLTALVCIFVAAARGAEGQKKRPITEIKIRNLETNEAAKVSYARQIKPILTDNCDECHSADEHKGAFEITSVVHLIKGGKKASPAIIPGKPDESPFVQYLRGQREPQMPKGNPALTEDELHLVRLWILAGAKDDSDTIVAEQKASKKEGAMAATLPAGELRNDPALQKAINVLMFSEDN